MGLLLALLALVMTWMPVTTDCRGWSEAVREYEVMTFEARVTGTIPQPDGSLAPAYAKAAQRYVVPASWGSACSGYPFPCLAIPTPVPPALGEVIYLSEPVAVDESRNRGDDPC